jgi:cysteine-rich repeat protein
MNCLPTLFASRRVFHGSLLAMLTLGGIFASNEAEAQSCPPGKTCFYVPPILPEPSVAPQNYGGDFALYAIGTNVTGTYSVNGGAALPFTAPASTPLLIPMTGTEGLLSGFLVPENRGMFIVADSPSLIVEQRVTAASWQASATMKSHVVGLGTRFRAGSFPLNIQNTNDGTGYDFLAFYAPTGTNVTVTAPPGSVAPFWNDGIPGLTHTFTLAAGQSYALRTMMGVDFDGALVTSTQPISVITGGRGWVSGCGDEGRDHLVPTNLLGTQFIVDDYPSPLSETLRVVTDTDNTQVSINGAVAATINAGQFFEPPLSGVTFIETSQPAYVFQNAGKVQCELDIAMIPPVVFAPVASSSISVNVIGVGHVIIYMPSAAVSSLQLDGGPLPSPQVALVPTHPEYSRVRFDVMEGDHVISAASDFQIGMVTFAPGATGMFAYYNPYRIATCSNGALNDGESCDDGNVDDGDGCSSTCEVEGGFICTGEPSVCTPDPCQFPVAVVCTPLDECHEAGVCDSDTGLCSDPEKVNGSACDDENACTQLDSCQSGVCSSGPAITCTALDECHDVGVCDSATGVCSNPDKPNGTSCNDTNSCTQTDTCQAGTCTGGNPVTCTALDECHDVGVCDSATGVCSNPDKPNGTSCNDTNSCTQTDTCQAGTCTGGNPITCIALDQCHDVGVCDSATGVCSNPDKPNGTSCNDTNSCTQTDTCQAGSCAGGNPSHVYRAGSMPRRGRMRFGYGCLLEP